MIDYVKSYEFISLLALFTYWIPLAVCSTVYFFRIIKLYKRDLKMCDTSSYYPKLTIGVIVGYIFASLMPVINILAMVFDCLGSIFKFIGCTFDTPLVRKRFIEEDK
jgi:hypothetical protein